MIVMRPAVGEVRTIEVYTIDGRLSLRDLKRIAAGPLSDPVIQCFAADRGLADILVIFHDKDGFRAADRRPGADVRQDVLSPHRAWKVELDRRSFPHLAVDFDVSA